MTQLIHGQPSRPTDEEINTNIFRCERGRLLNRAEGIVKSLGNVSEHGNRDQLDELIKDIAFLQLSTIMFYKRNKE